MTEFKDDVKRCLMKCGVEDKAGTGISELRKVNLSQNTGCMKVKQLREAIDAHHMPLQAPI